MKLNDEQLEQIWREIRVHSGLGNYDAVRFIRKWWGSSHGNVLRFIEAELASENPNAYLVQVVNEMVTDRLT